MTASRSIPPWSSKLIRAYAQRVGLAVWAWNSLHAKLFLMFWFLIGRTRYEAAHGIWHAIPSDSVQRELLSKTAEAELSQKKAILKRVKWILKIADTLGTYRNIAAHTPLTFSPMVIDGMAADGAAARTQARLKFNEIRHDQFWKHLTGDLLALSSYAEIIAWQIDDTLLEALGEPHEPLPYRPRLLSLRHIRKIEAQINHLAMKTAPPRPRSSFRGKRGLRS